MGKKVSQRTMKKRRQSNTQDKEIKIQRQTVFSRATEGHLHLTQQTHNDDDTDHWGDAIIDKPDGTLRIVSKQIGGIGLRSDNSKERELKTWLVEKEVDCVGLQETNIYLGKCRDKEQFRERMRHSR